MISVLIIIAIAAFFRFWHLADLFHWTMDEEFWSYLAWNITSGYHLPLIGGHIGGTGLYSGPTFIYLMSIVAKLFGGDPLGFGIFVSVIGVLTAVLMYVLGRQIFGTKIGLIAAILYSGSFLMAMFDRHYWNASLTPLLSLLSFFFVWKIKSGRPMYSIPLSLTLIIAFHAHGTGMALVLFTLFSWVIFHLPLRNKFTVIGVAIFLLGQLPLLFFDLRHNFQISKAAVGYLRVGNQQKISISGRAQNIADGFVSASQRIIYFSPADLSVEQNLCQNYRDLKGKPPPLLIILPALLLVFAFVKGKEDKFRLPIVLIGSSLIGLFAYNDFLPEYFFSPTFVPMFFLYSSCLIWLGDRLRKKFLLPLLLSVFLTANLYTLLTVRRSFSYDAKIKSASEVVRLVGNKPFNLQVQSNDLCQIYGFRYLFTYLRSEPVISYMDPYFSWLYENKLSKKSPQKNVLLKVYEDTVSVTITDNQKRKR